MIELIRQGKIAEALWFAQTELSPRGEENPSFLAELERTMTLFAFDIPATGPAAPEAHTTASQSPPATQSKSSKSRKSKEKETNTEKDPVEEWSSANLPASIAGLLRSSQRLATASEVNAAILAQQGYGATPKLPGLLRMLAWGEETLKARMTFPQLDMAELLDKTRYTTNADNLPPVDATAEPDKDAAVPMDLEV